MSLHFKLYQEEVELVDDVLAAGGDGLLVLVPDHAHHRAGHQAAQEQAEGQRSIHRHFRSKWLL